MLKPPPGWDVDAAAAVGTWRGRPVLETWERLAPLLRGRGISRVADLTDLDVLGVPVWAAVRPAAATLSVSAGKGLDHTGARVSAVMESLEVRAAEEFSPEIVAHGSAARLEPGYRVDGLSLHPVSLVDDATRLDWAEGWDLVTGRMTLIPAAAVGLRGWGAREWLPSTFVTTTNGLAGGNDHVEATIHGLLELVERDALANSTQDTYISVGLGDPGPRLGPLVAKLGESGTRVELRRIPSVPGTFTYACWLRQPEMWQVFGGSGSHPDPLVAAERAVLEAVQSRGSTISGGRDDIPEWTYRLQQAVPAPRRSAEEYAEPLPRSSGTRPRLAQVLADLVAAVHAHTGGPVVVCDLTPREEPWPTVVQVFAPGLGLALHHPRLRPAENRGAP